ncbi:hypothetical protein TNCV_3147811 [Trichonephila clavipes]|nr:hypothetical protein TNCV_3147811 [Trichonephila clavipes]
MFHKVYVLLNSPTVSEAFVAVEDDNVYIATIMADKDILKFVQSSKNIIDRDSDDEIGVNNATPVPTSSEMRNIMKMTLQKKSPKSAFTEKSLRELGYDREFIIHRRHCFCRVKVSNISITEKNAMQMG